jgi:hypothetical protein
VPDTVLDISSIETHLILTTHQEGTIVISNLPRVTQLVMADLASNLGSVTLELVFPINHHNSFFLLAVLGELRALCLLGFTA